MGLAKLRLSTVVTHDKLKVGKIIYKIKTIVIEWFNTQNKFGLKNIIKMLLIFINVG